jgi:hypothetical protein
MRRGIFLCLLLTGLARPALAQTTIFGTVHDQTGSPLPGVLVELSGPSSVARQTITDDTGRYGFDAVPAGLGRLAFILVNFAPVREDVQSGSGTTVQVDTVLHLSLSADVTVTGSRTFGNLADVPDPARNLVGIAESASQGAITARQLRTRPLMRTGEVLETVPGVVISQHSGEGKANQYYLRGFNLDHGTDFATTVAGMPVNMPTHAHGHGYSDLNFLIPELVSGVQFSKGPYFADQGDFATAGAANMNYVDVLERPMVRVTAGGEGFGRALLAGSHPVANGRVLAAVEGEHNDGPWMRGDDFRKFNGLIRYTRGDNLGGLSITGMGYNASWNSTDQIPQRAIDDGIVGRFGSLDTTDGGDSYRYSGSLEWQRARHNTVTRASAYGIAYNLNLFSNFTYFLDDPVRGDQFQQADHRFVTGGRVSQRRLTRWHGRSVQNTYGAQVRNDDIPTVGLYHTERRQPLATVRQDGVLQTSAAAYGQNEMAWTPWLRTLAGARVDGYRFRVDAEDPANAGLRRSSLVSPKGGVVLGPFHGTEIYANAGTGFHSNDARGATITRDPRTGDAADRVTPLVRAAGAEIGVRTVAVPHLQTTATLWRLDLASELVFAGDAGTTEAGRPSRRHGIELANYYSPWQRIAFDADLSWSDARFTDLDPAGNRIPGSVGSVIAAGVTVEDVRRVSGSVRLRYFGGRPLVEDGSVTSRPTTMMTVDGGYALSPRLRVSVDVFNALDARASDIDYFYVSRLSGEPAGGAADEHLHPALPRSVRISLTASF